ncbi:amidohydrolase [Amycolatopsis sp. GM8]|uniref:amidohydrolase family protein n=1 Tax=Amycolatopsis sp. GM8 TaxID=2896530 RepID=UPI001F47919B|nr:amidohydrolase family protein [Amycolatopsis sp. GM8]
MNARIDAHHHFWTIGDFGYPWMAGPEMDPIRRDFGPADLAPALGELGVAGTVLVQAVADIRETETFLRIADRTDFIRGVVGWVDLTSPEVVSDLDRLMAGPGGRWLVGIRHPAHDEQDADWHSRPDVRRGLRAVQERGLTYDLLVKARELPAAIRLAADLPDLRFVLDHIAKPAIASGADPAWTSRIPGLAELPNVAVKLSGMITEADWGSWRVDDLRPYVERVIELFGPGRLMFGSDWPVCLLAGSYREVLGAVAALLDSMSATEKDEIYGSTATRVYRLPAAPPGC